MSLIVVLLGEARHRSTIRVIIDWYIILDQLQNIDGKMVLTEIGT